MSDASQLLQDSITQINGRQLFQR